MTTNNLADWAGATRLVDAAQSILVVTHVSPDGDAIGSLIAMANALIERGKTVCAAVDGGISASFGFLPGAEKAVGELAEGEWDLMIAVDCGDVERTGLVGQYGIAHSKAVVDLDHHPTNTLFGAANLVMADAVSATEVIYYWLERMSHPISREVAVPLLTGLVTDTIGFRTSNVSAQTLNIAQRLMEAGASLTEITARALDTKSYGTVDLWRRALQSVGMEGAIIYATVTQEALTAAGLDETTDGGLVSFLVKVNEARIAVVFKERPDGRIELSFRAKPGFDVAKAATQLGGGGHTLAAGATIDGPLDAARKRVMPLLKKAARKGKLVIA